MQPNPIVVLDLVSFILSIVVFHFAHQTQKSFGGLFKSAFAMFYSVAVLSLSIAILELTGFIVPEVNASNIALHAFMFAVLLLMIVGVTKLRREMSFGEKLVKQIKS